MISSNFEKIIDTLIEYSTIDGDKFTPKVKDIFNAFSKCPYNDLKVVFIFDEPWKTVGYSDGIAMSCSNTKVIPDKFKHFEQALTSTIIQNEPLRLNNDFEYLSKQGILLLNPSLTTDIEKFYTRHYVLWNPFILYLLDMLSKNTNCIFVLVGKTSSLYERFVEGSIVINLPDIPGKFDRIVRWDCKDVFNNINIILTSQNKVPIVW
jgi:uracil-DNA glycosylase